MNDQTMTRRPSVGAVVGEQLRSVGLAIRRESVAAGVLLTGALLLTVVVQARMAAAGAIMNLDPGKEWGVIAGALALLFPLVVWKGEKAFGDTPLWLLPVDHRRHMLTKTAAGWLWLMAFLVVGLLFVALLMRLSGGTIGVEPRFLLLDPAAAKAGAAGATQVVLWTTPLWQWLVPFTAATAAYLLATGLLLGTRHPWWWLGGPWVLVLTLGVVSNAGNIDWLGQALEGAFLGIAAHPLGLDTLLTSGWDTLTTGFRSPSGGHRLGWYQMPSFGRWIAATALWTGLGLAALLGAVARPRDH